MLLFLFIPILLAAQVPERVILNLTAKPATSIAVTWRMNASLNNARVQYAVSTPWKQFEKEVSTGNAKMEKADIGNGSVAFHYSAIITGLRPSTRYVYRVGCDSAWSEWNQFSTSSDKAEPFSFVFFGDPQNDITEHCSRVFRQAFQTAGGASFWLFCGDMTSEPDDNQIGELFTAAGFVLRTTPSVMIPGNHDMGYKTEYGRIVLNKNGKKIRTKNVSPLWNLYYTLPENGIPGYEEVSYTFDYQGVRFIMINSNDRLQEQAVWMENLLAANPNTWTVVTFHHPLYSNAQERDERETRTAFQHIFDTYHVDMVLTGHDHSYARSHKINNGKVVSDQEQGTVYILSVSGPKQYVVSFEYKELMAKVEGNVQLFQVISVTGNTLNYKSFTAAGTLFDEFSLRK